MTAITATVLADSWGWHHGDAGIGWWIVMMLGMVIFWGAMIALGVWLVRGGPTPRGEAPQEILRRRLADGSISVEEYEQRRATLESSMSTSKDDAPRAGPTAGPSTPSPSPST